MIFSTNRAQKNLNFNCEENKVTIKMPLFSELQKKMSEITATSVTQGKTWLNDEECCAAVHAVDKDLSQAAVTHTEDGAGWYKLQFDKTYFIHMAVIYYRFYNNWYHPNEHCAQSETNFKTCVDNENSVDVSVYQGEVKQKSCGTLQLTYGLEQSDQIYTLLCNAEGDTVKLSKGTGAIVLLEVVVIGKGKLTSLLRRVYSQVGRSKDHHICLTAVLM